MAKKPAQPDSGKPSGEVAREMTLSIPVPELLHHALKMRAVQERTTVRAVVLRGLMALGFDVPAGELMDRRAGRAGRPKGS